MITKEYVQWLVEVKDETVNKSLCIVAVPRSTTCEWQELNFLYMMEVLVLALQLPVG